MLQDNSGQKSDRIEVQHLCAPESFVGLNNRHWLLIAIGLSRRLMRFWVTGRVLIPLSLRSVRFESALINTYYIHRIFPAVLMYMKRVPRSVRTVYGRAMCPDNLYLTIIVFLILWTSLLTP